MTASRLLSPSMAGSVLLHLVVALALLISWPFAKELKIGASVPVTLVNNAPATNMRPAVQAPEAAPPQTEVPAPDAPMETVTPAPDPVPAPPTAKAPPAPKPPAPAPQAVKPAPTKPTPAKPKPADVDFDALLASINKPAKVSGAARANAQRGPNRPETAREARPDLGSGLAASALTGLADELQRRWTPNCEVEGGRDVQIRTTFRLGPTGQVVGDVKSEIKAGQGGVAQAAAERATRAVYAAQPFQNLPRQLYGQPIAVNFNAREACS